MMMPIVQWDEAKQAYVPADKPKLQPACQMPAVDGQEVFAQSSEVKKAQARGAGVPAAQPPGRLPDLRSGRRVQAAGLLRRAPGARPSASAPSPCTRSRPSASATTIVYDGERCVMCTRCIRFCDEVVGDHVLDMRERGNKNEITLVAGSRARPQVHADDRARVPGRRAHQPRLPLQGARLVPASRSRACARGCATGCNMLVDYDPRNNTVHRLRPRDNAEVNQFWMCDDGMMSYQRFHEERVATGRVRDGAAARQRGRRRRGARGGGQAAQERRRRQARRRAQRAALQRGQPRAGAARARSSARASSTWRRWAAGRATRSCATPTTTRTARARAGRRRRAARALSELVARRRGAATVEGVLALGWASAESAEQLAPLRDAQACVSLSQQRGRAARASPAWSSRWRSTPRRTARSSTPRASRSSSSAPCSRPRACALPGRRSPRSRRRSVETLALRHAQRGARARCPSRSPRRRHSV